MFGAKVTEDKHRHYLGSGVSICGNGSGKKSPQTDRKAINATWAATAAGVRVRWLTFSFTRDSTSPKAPDMARARDGR